MLHASLQTSMKENRQSESSTSCARILPVDGTKASISNQEKATKLTSQAKFRGTIKMGNCA